MWIQTGNNPECPPHVCKAKRLHYRIEEHADSSTMVDGNNADLGFNDLNGEEGIDKDATSSQAPEAPEAGGLCRVLFNQDAGQDSIRPHSRPLVRNNGGGSNNMNNNNMNMMSDVMQLLLASLESHMQHEDSDHEERCHAQQMQQQMNMAMIMAMVSAVNPAASLLLALNIADAQNNQACEEETRGSNGEER